MLSGANDNKTDITIHNNILDGQTYDILVNDNVNANGGFNSLRNDPYISLGEGSSYRGTRNDLYQQNPMFVDIEAFNFNLLPTSYLRDAGKYVGLDSDYSRNPVPEGDAPDIGALEYIDNQPPALEIPTQLSEGIQVETKGDSQGNENNFFTGLLQFSQNFSPIKLVDLLNAITKFNCPEIGTIHMLCFHTFQQQQVGY